jgi:hypothetical protein
MPNQQDHESTGRNHNRSRHKLSMEKKIEKLWDEAEKDGWDFNYFTSNLLTIAVVLSHRRHFRYRTQGPKSA